MENNLDVSKQRICCNPFGLIGTELGDAIGEVKFIDSVLENKIVNMITKKEFIARVEEIRSSVALEDIVYKSSISSSRVFENKDSINSLIVSLKKDLGLRGDTYILEDFFWEKRFIGSYKKLYKKIKRVVNDDFFVKNYLNSLRDVCHGDSVASGWYTNIANGEKLIRNKGEQLMLIVSEIAEAMEGERKCLKDDHLPDRTMAEVELADAVIRILDYCGANNYDISGAIFDKLSYNRKRADHKIENRVKEAGKSW